MDSPEKYERVVGKFFPGYRLINSWPLSGGISTQMIGMEVSCPAGEAEDTRKLILRRPKKIALGMNPSAAEDEFRLLKFLKTNGLPVPEPVGMDHSGELFSDDCLILTYLEGRPDFCPANPVEHALKMAQTLSRIHSTSGVPAELSFLPQIGQGQCFKPQPAELGAALGDDRLWAAVNAGWPCSSTYPAALLHGDFWPGNILWQDGQLSGVIDWEDAVIGDPLTDLAISRLDLLWIYGQDAMDAFTRRYLSLSGIHPERLGYWDLVAAQRLARLVGKDLGAWAAFFEPFGRMDISPRSIRTHFQSFVSQAYTQLGYL
jgi:aminoglycoside phosphotransferase (APT) family kinase protein